jgi:hypothetical protein
MTHKPKELVITKEKMVELKQRVLDGIKQKLSGAKELVDTQKEIAAGIYVYSIEELGKLILLDNFRKEDDNYIIEYAHKFVSHSAKFELVSDYLQKNNKDECIVLNNEGDFTSDSFVWKDFNLGLLPQTEARLNVFYADLEYDSTTSKVDAIKKIPTVYETKIKTAIDSLENIVNKWD